VDVYSRLPAIVSIECTGERRFFGKEGVRVCKGCKDLRASRGSTNPSGPIDRWAKIISRGIERRDKGVLTDSDVDNVAVLVKIANKYLAPKGP